MRKSIGFAVWIALLSFLPQPVFSQGRQSQSQPKDGHPNVLFILTDDQRWDAMGCYGNSSVRTPTLDSLAARGARFDAFYVAGPVCGPSRAAFLTGLYPHQVLEAGTGDLPVNTPTIARYLNDAGYVTGFVGKAHLGGDPRKWGFEETPLFLPEASIHYQNPPLFVDGIRQQVQGDITTIFVDGAIKFIQKHQSDRWFLWLAVTAPHEPLVLYPDYKYDKSQIQPPPGWPPGQPFKSENWLRYYSTISMLDGQIGRIMNTLETLGLLKNTFIFVAGDNGFMHESHGFKEKGVWFEESARTPCLAFWPEKIPAGTVVKSVVSNVDFVPTVLDFAGIKTRKAPLEGYSLRSAFNGSAERSKAFSEMKIADPERGGVWQMVRSKDYKYVLLKSGEQHLYDLGQDPHELNDLIADTKYSKTVAELKASLADWMKKTPQYSCMKHIGNEYIKSFCLDQPQTAPHKH